MKAVTPLPFSTLRLGYMFLERNQVSWSIILARGVLTPLEFMTCFQLPIPTFAPRAIPSKLKQLLESHSLWTRLSRYVLSFVSTLFRTDQQDFYTPFDHHNCRRFCTITSRWIIGPMTSLLVSGVFTFNQSQILNPDFSTSVLYFGTRGTSFVDLSP